jgi:predicted O-methyltransferase YrrM
MRFHRWLRPSLMDAAASTGGLQCSALDVVRRLGITIDAADWASLTHEMHGVQEEIVALGKKGQATQYAETWSVGTETSLLLYALVRLLKPRTVLETGVASGSSTAVILAAMIRNGDGELVSTDIDPRAGELVPVEWRPRWRLVVLTGNAPQQFARLVGGFEQIDLFIHDSLHEYAWQSMELRTVWPKLAQRGLVAADDAHSCNAFLDFCRDRGVEPLILVEPKKIFGIGRRTGGECGRSRQHDALDR